MRIESGSTGERRTRVAIFLVMCIAFSGWFAYDGLVGYPQKNLEWARQALPEKLDNLQADPRVNSGNLDKMSIGMTRQQLEDLLGSPVYEENKQLKYVGADVAATVHIANDRVVEVRTEQVKPGQSPKTPNFRVRVERLERIGPDMPQAAVIQELGEPETIQEQRLWFVGPASYAAVEVQDDKIAKAPLVRKNTEPSDGDIFMQKAIAAVLAVIALFVAWRLLDVLTLRVVLDDEGLLFRKQRISWDSMTALKTDDYAARGWVDMVYTDGASSKVRRLDSYHIDRFNEIIDAICSRMGFARPTLPPSPEEQG